MILAKCHLCLFCSCRAKVQSLERYADRKLPRHGVSLKDLSEVAESVVRHRCSQSLEIELIFGAFL